MSTTDSAIAPIDLTFELACTQAHAFQAFTDHMAKWWPLSTHSVAGAKAATCHFEARPGGRIFETAADGTEHEWGKVLACDFPRHLKFTWHPGREPELGTEVEVTFAPQGGKTSMRLVHRGWETYGDEADEMRGRYTTGWQTVVGTRYAGFIETGEG